MLGQGQSNQISFTNKAARKIKIIIADDHTVVREGLSYILNAEEDFEVVGAAGDGQEVVEMVRRLEPDIVLMDLQMPRLNGVEAIKRLQAENNQSKIIILTTFDTDDYIFEGIQAGAKGYLLKDVPKAELAQVIRLVHQGQTYTQPAISARLFNIVARQGSKLVQPQLTEREIGVLKLLARGDRNKEIAVKLNISESTVKGHVTIILQKFNVSDRTEAAMYAVQQGLIKLDKPIK